MACWGWGYNEDGQARPPGGEFRSVSAGYLHTCGVRTDGSVECWGNNESGQSRAPGGEFRAVSAGAGHTCGVRADGSMDCWGIHTCELHDDFGVECLFYNYDEEARPPSGKFR